MNKKRIENTAQNKAPAGNLSLHVTIIIAALIIGGGLAYAGYVLSQKGTVVQGNTETTDLSEQIAKGVDDYIKKQQEAQIKAEAEANKPQKSAAEISIDDDAILGDKNAPVTIVEFSDYECPFCKRAFDNALKQIKTEYIDTGKVRLVFRDFPLSFHPNALPAAMAAECAGDQGKYYEMHDLLFANQTDLKNENYKKWASELGLNRTTFDTCLDGETHKAEIQKDMAEGQKYGVSGTPGFFVNGWHIKGAAGFATFQQYIEQELAAAGN